MTALTKNTHRTRPAVAPFPNRMLHRYGRLILWAVHGTMGRPAQGMCAMAKLPAFQFYPGDWLKDPGVQALDYESRGVWFELLLLMFESEKRGYLMLNGKGMTDEIVKKLLGIHGNKWKKIKRKLIDTGVATVEKNTGIMYNRRMVKDEEIRRKRIDGGYLGAKYGALGGRPAKPLTPPLQKPLKNPPSSSSSSSSSSLKREEDESALPPSKNISRPEHQQYEPPPPEIDEAVLRCADIWCEINGRDRANINSRWWDMLADAVADHGEQAVANWLSKNKSRKLGWLLGSLTETHFKKLTQDQDKPEIDYDAIRRRIEHADN